MLRSTKGVLGILLVFYLREACLRIVDVRGIMGRACAKQWGAHVQSNGLRMCKAMGRACARHWPAHVKSNGLRMCKAMVVRNAHGDGCIYLQIQVHH